MSTISITHLAKRYRRVEALKDVSFELRPGRCCGLIGPNGAGKSTLLHCLAGIVAPDRGSISRLSADGTRHEDVRALLGFAPDDLPMPDLLTGMEYLELVAHLRGVRLRLPALQRLVETLRLEDALQRMVGDYSHGMRRKISLIGAMLHDPLVLILDEPLRGLDPESAALVKSIIRHYVAGDRLVLLSTHDMLAAENLCQDVVILDHGRVVAAGPVNEVSGLTTTGTLEESLLHLTGQGDRALDSERDFFGLLAGCVQGA